MKKLLCFGFGYTASYLAKIVDNYTIIGTKRRYNSKEEVQIIKFDDLSQIEQDTTHILISIPPEHGKDIIYEKFYNQIANLKQLEWLGYLSTTGVYGDHQGEWVDESSKTNPTNDRSKARLTIEKQWLKLYKKYNVPIIIFRLAGIYGIGRNPLERLIDNEDITVIEAKGKFFSRIHVEDIANILKISMDNPIPGEIYNIADDKPAEASKIIEYCYKLLDKTPKNYQNLETANISPMMNEFYRDNKRVSNIRIKDFIKTDLKYSSYIEGLNSIKDLILEPKY